MADSKVCAFHPYRDAIAECKQCKKPLCFDCRMRKYEGFFCSDECYEAFKQFQDEIEFKDEVSEPLWHVLLETGFKIFFVLLVLFGIYYILFEAGGLRIIEDLLELLKALIKSLLGAIF